MSRMNFPCFTIKAELLDPSFLKWWFSRESTWLRALGLSAGATPTSRKRLKEAHLFGMSVAVPPLDEPHHRADCCARRSFSANTMPWPIRQRAASRLPPPTRSTRSSSSRSRTRWCLISEARTPRAALSAVSTVWNKTTNCVSPPSSRWSPRYRRWRAASSSSSSCLQCATCCGWPR